ncbi:hypothetical protein BD310DRAFT_940229 [Dichomitus squalens]|uniref:Uncharacterized protein n=1 Tax=Dichomitus squalens TaxID=114155 RepID=A0A4Q9PGN2_9APHY|nr:hypothetical protein BD310DRAFT_940229 [Dichomitus squalens]
MSAVMACHSIRDSTDAGQPWIAWVSAASRGRADMNPALSRGLTTHDPVRLFWSFLDCYDRATEVTNSCIRF